MTAVEHEIQRQLLERLGIEWTPGEPFYSLIDGEITRLRQEVERLRAALEQLDDACDRNIGGLHEGPFSDARRNAKAVLG